MPAATNRLRLGLNVPVWPSRRRPVPSWPRIRDLARDAEALGIDTLWVPDQLQVRRRDGSIAGFWECWTILSALAEATDRVEIGTLVLSAGYRSPGLLAKMATTLDEVSGGRLVLGIGTGVPDADEGWAAFGYDATAHVSRFEEAIEIVARLLREGRLTFEGRFHHLADAELVPGGPRPGGPPIWVGSGGIRTARIAARWADAINVNMPLTDRASVDAALARVRRACEDIGRDPATLALTGWSRIEVTTERSTAAATGARTDTISGSAEVVAERLLDLREAGIEHLTCYVGDDGDRSPFPALTRDALERFAPVIEAIGASGEQHARASS